MELELEGIKLKVYESGEIYRLFKKGWSLIKGSISSGGYKLIDFRKRNKEKQGRQYLFHRIVYKAFNPDWDILDTICDIDHINGDTLDNRICNLRELTHSQNMTNNKSKGYYWCNHWKRWIAKISFANNKTYTKSCKTEEEAIQAVRELRLKHFPFYERTAMPEGE